MIGMGGKLAPFSQADNPEKPVRAVVFKGPANPFARYGDKIQRFV